MLSEIHDNAAWMPGFGENQVLTIPDFLPAQERDVLFNRISDNRSAFKHRIAAGVPVEGAQYFSVVAENEGNYGFAGSDDQAATDVEQQNLRNACQNFLEKVLAITPSLIRLFNLNPLTVDILPLNIVNGGQGHLGYPHQDSSGNRFKISLLYYLHSHPKVFKGGELEFFKASSEQTQGYFPTPQCTLKHQDNMLVAFPSDTYHGVTEVLSESTEFMNGRFAFVSFI